MEGSSCAQLETIINDAGLYAGYDNRTSICMDDIVRAFSVIRFRTLCKEQEKEESAIMDSDEIERIVYHEAGHVIVSEVLDRGSVNYVYYDNCDVRCGITVYSFENTMRCNYLFLSQEISICRSLAGRIATELVFGTLDVGCSKDIEAAVEILEEMLGDNCAVEYGHYRDYMVGDLDRQRSHTIITYELARYSSIARRILMKNRDFLDAIANTLLEKHYLLRSDIKKLEDTYNITGGGIEFGW